MIQWIHVVNDGLMMGIDICSDVTLTDPPSVFLLLNTLYNNVVFLLRSCHECCRLYNLYSLTYQSETCFLHFIPESRSPGSRRNGGQAAQRAAPDVNQRLDTGQMLLDYRSSGQPRWEKNKLRCRERNRNVLSEQTGRCMPTKLYNCDLIKRRRTTLLLLLLFSFSVITQLGEISRSRCSQQCPGSGLKPVSVQLVSSLTSLPTSRRGEEEPDVSRWSVTPNKDVSAATFVFGAAAARHEYFCRHVWVLILLSTRRTTITYDASTSEELKMFRYKKLLHCNVVPASCGFKTY